MSQQTAEMFRTSCGATAPLELAVTGPGVVNQRPVFELPFVLAGRHERNGLRLEDNAVSRQHAYLQQIGGRVFCVDLGSRTGIRWAGVPRPTGWLRPQEGVQIGPFSLEPALAAQAGGQPGEPAEDWNPLQDRESESPYLPQITVEQGNEVRARLPMNRVLVLVGSSPLCRIRLRDAGVSRFHCSLLRTPQGVWLVDLLYGAGASLNGKSVPWALLQEGDRLHVGSYVLHISYPEVPAEAPPPITAAIPALTPAQPTATAASLLPALQAELNQARERLVDAEGVRQQLADSQAEHDRLREQARILEVQVAEMSQLQARLEAAESSASELDAVRGDCGHWQAEAQHLHAKLAADLQAAQAERDRLQTEEQTARHAAEEASARASNLDRALAEAAAAHETALALASAGWELERQALAAQLEQERQCHNEAVQATLRDSQAQAADAAEVVRQQLADKQAECDGLREQARILEIQVAEIASLQARLEAAEASARELDVVRGERDRWQTEAQNIQARLATNPADREQFDRLAADLHAAQLERSLLQTEERTARQAADEEAARASELERALAEAAAAHEAALAQARAGWEPERQALAAQLERERQTRNEAIQAAMRDVQARVSVAMAEWQQRFDSAQQQLVWERGLAQTQSEQLRQQIANLLTDRDYLLVQLGQAETRLRAAGAPASTEAGHAAEAQRPSQQTVQDQVFAQFPGRRP